jgi:hypothetical protein
VATGVSDDLAALKAEADAAYSRTVPAGGVAMTVQPGAAPVWWTTTNAMTMCAVVLLFGVLVLGLATYLMRVGKAGTSVLRIFGTILVIVMATFLVVAGYDNAQLGAPLGLLGTIVGYLLGKDTSGEKPNPPPG